MGVPYSFLTWYFPKSVFTDFTKFLRVLSNFTDFANFCGFDFSPTANALGFQLLYPGFGFLFGASSPAKLFAVAGAEFHSGWLRIVADFAKFSGGFCENLRILRCFLRNLADFAKSGGFCDFLRIL